MQDQKEASEDINWIAVIKISEAIVVIAGTYITAIEKRDPGSKKKGGKSVDKPSSHIFLRFGSCYSRGQRKMVRRSKTKRGCRRMRTVGEEIHIGAHYFFFSVEKTTTSETAEAVIVFSVTFRQLIGARKCAL